MYQQRIFVLISLFDSSRYPLYNGEYTASLFYYIKSMSLFDFYKLKTKNIREIAKGYPT